MTRWIDKMFYDFSSKLILKFGYVTLFNLTMFNIMEPTMYTCEGCIVTIIVESNL